MKKLFLLFATLLGSVGVSAYDIEDGYFYYNITSSYSHEVELASCSSSLSGSVEIPSEVYAWGDWYSVTSIGEYAFQSGSSITSITIPNSVTSINYCAFYGCI